jgi:hypothetical protein
MATSTTLQRYSPSGFFQPLTFALFLAATAGGFAAAWVYQLAMHWIPFIYLNLLICAGFGFGLGWAASWAIKTGHCRNRMIALLLALPLVVVAIGGSHFWEYTRFISDVRENVAKEKNLELTNAEVRAELPFSKYVELKVEEGWQVSNHGSSGSKMNGFMVYVVWGIEALILLGIAIGMTWKAVGEPYCERCNLWGAEKKMLLQGLSRADADPLLQSGDLDGVIQLPLPADPNLSVALALTATLCPRCADTSFLTVEEKRVTAKKKGKPQEATTALIKHAVMRTDQRSKFLDRLEPKATAAAG